MKKFILIFLFFLTSCSTSKTINTLDFSKDMSFDEFKIKLEEYGKNSPYPNIDD